MTVTDHAPTFHPLEVLDQIVEAEKNTRMTVPMSDLLPLLSFSNPEDWGDYPAKMALDTGAHKTWPMTVTALLELTSMVGLPKPYVRRSPRLLTQEALNYWLGSKHFEDRSVSLLLVDGVVQSVSKPVKDVRSTLDMVEVAMGVLPDADWRLDQKFHRDVNLTAVRLVDVSQTVTAYGHDWHFGVFIQNSLTGKNSILIDPYFVRTDGLGVQFTSESGQWMRRPNKAEDNSFDIWISLAVEEAQNFFTSAFTSSLEDLVGSSAESVTAILADLFVASKTPPKIRETIIMAALESVGKGNLGDMFDLAMVFSGVADSSGITPGDVDYLLRMPAFLALTELDRCGSCHRLQC